MSKDNFWALMGYLTAVLFHGALIFYWMTVPDAVKLFSIPVALAYAFALMYAFAFTFKTQITATGKQMAAGIGGFGIGVLKFLLPALAIYTIASLFTIIPTQLREVIMTFSMVAVGFVLSFWTAVMLPMTLVSLFFIVRKR